MEPFFADLATLQQTLGVSFNDLSLLEQALVHSSYLNENPDFAPNSNERLEFLGDAVLGVVIAEKLYQECLYSNEGEMTRLRADLVRRDTLARIAKAISLGHYLYMGKGEEASGGRRNPANLAGAMEAMIAAVFLDQGPAAARNFILRLLDTELQKIVSHGVVVDDKSRLQQLIQASVQQTPFYRVVQATGPDHNKRFAVEVRLGDTVLGTGSGRSKKAAEIEAARAALEHFSNHFTQ